MDTPDENTTKKELIGWIQSLKDDSILSLLNTFKLSSEGKNSDWWNELTEKDKINILDGINEYQKGDILKSSEFWNSLSNG
jgi:hypothetical protein